MGRIVIRIREANESDAEGIRDIYLATYGIDYAYPQYYDIDLLKKMIFSDDRLILVAEQEETNRLLGTASVLLEVGASADQIGEFGRLAVHPEGRRQGIGRALMEARLDQVRNRLHLGLVDARASHPFSQQIATSCGFATVGLLPMNLLISQRESTVLMAQYFGEALELRKNNPRVIPEVHYLAESSLAACGIKPDAIVDEASSAYPDCDAFAIEELKPDRYCELLRFQRGRICRREIFGPLRLHYGLSKLAARHSHYLMACAGDEVVGAIGFAVDDYEKTVRIFELISLSDQSIRFLLNSIAKWCRSVWGVEYIEVDVNAESPAMQRTLLELGFLPAAYVPAMVFHEVERIDAVKMVRILVPLNVGNVRLAPESEALSKHVLGSFSRREVLPRIAESAPKAFLFEGLDRQQTLELTSACRMETFSTGQLIFAENTRDDRTYLILTGRVAVGIGHPPRIVGHLNEGECLGEMALLSAEPHSTSAIAETDVEAAVLEHEDLKRLLRRRPDIGLILYRNLATGLGKKLRRSDSRTVHSD